MPFDLSSASPIDAGSSGGFDLSSASPIGSTEAPKRPAAATKSRSMPEALGVMEPLLAMGTGMLAKPVSDIAGLAATGKELISPTPGGGDPSGFKRSVQESLTYQPRSELGRSPYNPFNFIPRAVGTAVDYVGRKAGELAAPPTTSGPLRSGIGYGIKGLTEESAPFIGLKAPWATGKVAAGLRGESERFMHSALKPGIKYAGKADDVINTLLEKRINVTPGGLDKLRDQIGDLNSRIGQMIDNSPAMIDKRKVATRLYDVIDRFEKQVDPHADLKVIEKSWQNFLNHPLFTGKDIPIKSAQQLKQGTYTQLRDKYGELGSAETEAQKALARGLKEEIVKAVPQVRELNAEESRLLRALDPVERRVLVSANKNPVGLGVLALHPKNIAVWMADRSELFKSLLARMFNAGSRGMPSGRFAGPIAGELGTMEANNPLRIDITGGNPPQ